MKIVGNDEWLIIQYMRGLLDLLGAEIEWAQIQSDFSLLFEAVSTLDSNVTVSRPERGRR